MMWRWDDGYDAAEAHGQHVEGSLDWYSEWAGPLGGQVFAAADRLSSLSSRLLVAPEGLTAGSSPARGHTQKEAGSAVLGSDAPRSAPASLCVCCDGLGCEFCGMAAA